MTKRFQLRIGTGLFSGISDGGLYAAVSASGHGVYQDTGYDLGSTSDVFDLSFWQGVHQAGEGTVATIKWQLFTTTTGDNTGNIDQVIATDTFAANTTSEPIEMSYSGIGTVPSGSVGDRLFFAIVGESGSGYYSADEVNLTVIPPPAGTVIMIQ